MFSIVIPLYNKETYIAHTINSVLDQVYTKFELIIIDDGSTDDSLKIAQSANDDRIKIISIENSGVSMARNKGIKNATYNWIAFLDADDWWAPTFLEEICNTIYLYPNKKLFASGRSRVFKTRKERYAHEFLPKDEETDVINYFKVISKYLPLINSSNVVIEKSLFEKIGNFREGQKKHEDQDLWMRLCINEEVVFVNQQLSFHRITSEMSASKRYYQPLDFCVFLRSLIEIREKISSNKKKYFKEYCNKFVLLTYLKFYNQYSKEDDNKVFNLMIKLLTGKYLFICKAAKIFPFKNTYTKLKIFKR